jgi:hypothetical protein
MDRTPGSRAARGAVPPAPIAVLPNCSGFHRRWQRFACIVTHRRAGKTVAGIRNARERT